MKVYSISYDLNNHHKNYDGFYSAIKDYPSCIQALDSTWFIKSDSSINNICNHLSRELDDNDFLLVSELNSNCHGYLNKNIWDWLQS